MLWPTWILRIRAPGRPLATPAAALALLILVTPHLGAQWRLESWLGDAWSIPTSVTFSQVNQPDITATGHWSTRPFEPTWYYAGRIARWSGRSAWAFQYVHDKVYLDDPPPEVKFFRITNGVNFFLGERLWRTSGWEYGLGAGPVMVVPVSSVRGLTYDHAHGILHSTYEFGGGVVQGNLARRIRLLPFVYVDLSLMSTASYLRVRIANGHATLLNFALHAQYGLSLQAGK